MAGSRKDADPSQIEGKKRMRYMDEGYMTAMRSERPLVMLGPSLDDNQLFEIRYNKDRKTFCIMSMKHKEMSLHYNTPVMANMPVVLQKEPCEFRICESDKGEGWYQIYPAKGSEECPDCQVGMTMHRIWPPMIGMVPQYIERFSWRFENP